MSCALCKWTNKKVNGSVSVCVWVWRYASILRPDCLTQPPVSRTRQMGDIKRSMPWQGSLSKLGRTVTGVMFWQGIKCLLRRRPVCHSMRLMYRYRWLYNTCLWGFCMLMSWLLLSSGPDLTRLMISLSRVTPNLKRRCIIEWLKCD